MLEYELFYLVGETQENELSQVKDAIGKIVATAGGTGLPGEWSEKRKLAYPIRRETKGVYIAQRFTTPDKDERDAVGSEEKNIVAALTRELNLYRGILRFIIVRADALPPLGERSEFHNSLKQAVQPKTDARRRPSVRPAIPRPEKISETPTDKPVVSDKDIDKKLEEVLNI